VNVFPTITNHCVIDEQDDHIVIAIRIPKTEIAANALLLAGLAKVAPQWSSEPVADLG
jgi:hypothetical protein